MHRIDHATATPGNLFTKGNPATATPATTVTDDWLNDVQENIGDLIESAGIALVKGDYTQLRQAIQAMFVANQKALVINNATFEASVANGEVVRWDAGNTRFDEAVADGTANNRAVGIADVTNSKVYLYGECPLFSGLTPGARYYLDTSTPGAITTTAPTDAVIVGIAKSATALWVDVDAVYPAATQAEMEAGAETALRSVSPLLVKQAIAARKKSKVGTFTRDMTAANGTQVISGLGFVPRIIHFSGRTLSGNPAGLVNGWTNGVGQGSLGQSAAGFLYVNGNCINLPDSVTGNADQSGSVLSADMIYDQFTINWTKFGTLAAGIASLNYIAEE